MYTRCYKMYTHVITGCTLTLLLDVQKLEMYKTGNVQPRATEYTKKKFVKTYQHGI